MLSFKMETGERRIRRMFEIGEYVVCGAKGVFSYHARHIFQDEIGRAHV